MSLATLLEETRRRLASTRMGDGMSSDRVGTRETVRVTTSILYKWRGSLIDDELADLTRAHGGRPTNGWWTQTQPHSLGWVTARNDAELLVGFVNVAWDGGDHAFLLDTKTHGEYQRHGIGTGIVKVAVRNARAAGCEWLHVDFEPRLGPFYLDACGFKRTEAGLIHLPAVD